MAARRARRTARGNRWGLAVVGAVLFAGGAAASAAGAGLLGGSAAGAELGALAGTAPGWLPWAAAAAAVLIALLALRWIAAQGRTDTVGSVQLEPEGGADSGAGPGTGRTTLTAGAAQEALEQAAAACPGVRRARARITESSRTPGLRVDVTLDDDADIAAVCGTLRTGPLNDLRTALERDRLRTVLRLTMAAPADQPRVA
ncbi:alkaline shock response membrane anchor protein AmaP [Nocardiopsis coralliicola]